MRPITHLVRWLDGPAAARRVVIIGVLLVTPSLAAGLALDDYFHQAMIEGRPELGIAASATDIFRFVPNDEQLPNTLLRQRGLLPWYADDELRASFWRPLASLTHWIVWQGRRFVPFVPPAVGRTVTLPEIDLLALLLS
jgi:hypothetical protein